MLTKLGSFIGKLEVRSAAALVGYRSYAKNIGTPSEIKHAANMINQNQSIKNMTNTSIDPKRAMAEAYISSLMARPVPYDIDILNNKFVIKDHNTYPPGNLSRMLGEFIVQSKVTEGKVVADVGMGSFALGIIAAKNGAKHVIGSDFTEDVLKTAKENIQRNNVDEKMVSLYKGNSVYALLPEYEGKIDIIFCGSPWDSITQAEFDKISDNRKPLSYAFYDIDDNLIKGLMTDGFKLLSKDGRIFITNAESHIERIDQLCKEHNLKYNIVKAEDIHKDGNIHFILELVNISK